MTRRPVIPLETAAAAALAAVGMGAAVLAWRMGVWTDGSPGAGLMPFASAVLLAMLALASAWAPLEEVEAGPDLRRLVWYLAGIAAFCAIPPVAGSLAGFSLALFLLMRFGERRPWRSALGWSLGMSIAAVAGFRYLLGVPLPAPLLQRLVGY